MVSDVEGDAASLDYQHCGFEGTRLVFRGPAPDFGDPFVAVLGGSETYGKFAPQAFPCLLQEWLDTPVMNLGVQHAGLSLFSEERWLLDTASKAKVAVLQVLGAQNMSNRLYSVHSRRNDRFLGVSPALRDMYPAVDFTEVNFTGHLLKLLSSQSPGAFDVLVEELKWAWVQRMRRLVRTIGCDVVLLWISDRAPEDTRNSIQETEPLFVDRNMLDELSDDVAGVVEVVGLSNSLEGKVFAEGEAHAARPLPTPLDHARVAEALARKLQDWVDGPGKAASARAMG